MSTGACIRASSRPSSNAHARCGWIIRSARRISGRWSAPPRRSASPGEVAAAVAAGARAALAGHRAGELAGQSAYLSPEVLLDVNADMAIEREETFGPVATLTAVDGDAQALAAINASRFGLTASVWTREPQAAAGLIDAIQAGTVFVNRCDHADLHLPWGGTKCSGLGRIGAGASFDEWVELKSVHVREMEAK